MVDELSRDFHHNLTDHHNVELIVGFARFIDSHTLGVGERIIEPDRILLTPGSHSETPSLGDTNVELLSLQTLLDLDVLPRRIIFSETSSAGVAFAQAMAR